MPTRIWFMALRPAFNERKRTGDLPVLVDVFLSVRGFARLRGAGQLRAYKAAAVLLSY